MQNGRILLAGSLQDETASARADLTAVAPLQLLEIVLEYIEEAALQGRDGYYNSNHPCSATIGHLSQAMTPEADV